MVSLVRGIALMTEAPRSGEGSLCRRDKTLGAPAFRAFIDVMQKTRLFLLDARKPHPPTAFEANGLLAKRLRSGLRFHEPLSAKASQGSMTGWFTPILSGPAAGTARHPDLWVPLSVAHSLPIYWRRDFGCDSVARTDNAGMSATDCCKAPSLSEGSYHG
jgi:hypothetical protein